MLLRPRLTSEPVRQEHDHPAAGLGLDDVLIGIVFCLPLAALYLVGCLRTVGPGDMAELTVASYTLGIPHPPGYPVYTWFGKVFSLLPLDGRAFRINAMSSVFAFTALLLAFLIVVAEVRQVFGRTRMVYLYGALTVVLLGLTRPFWHYAQVAEVYSLNAVLVLLFILLFMTWQSTRGPRMLAGAALVLGLTLGTHLSNMLIVPVFLLLIWLITHDLRSVLRSCALVLVGAAQYVYLILRAMQSPSYLHPHARFFDSLQGTGTADPLYNWFWFMTGARWRGHYVGSAEDALRKLAEFRVAVLENYTAASLVVLLVGMGLYIHKCVDRKRAVILISLLALQFAYFVGYEWSSPGMILPMFALCSILIALGTCSVSNLLGSLPRGHASRRVVSCVSAAAISAWFMSAPVSRPAVDLSHLTAPSLWMRKTITSLPQGSKIDGITWDYARVIDYYRLVEETHIPFRAAECDSEAICEGTCFVLAVGRAIQKYGRAGYQLTPALYVKETPIVYQVSPGRRTGASGVSE